MIRVAIVEDDCVYAEQLTAFLKTYEFDYDEQIHITIFADGGEIAEHYKSRFDIILMDIEMGFMDGMTAAEMIRKLDKEVIIIFITNMSQYAIRGYEVDALDYVLKPVTYFAFSQRLQRAIARMHVREETYLVIHFKTGLMKIVLSDLYWIESVGHRLTYHTKQGAYESTSNSIHKIEEKLGSDHFFRCNKSYLVNLAHVKEIKEGCVLVNGTKIVISRGRKNDLLKALAHYMGEIIK